PVARASLLEAVRSVPAPSARPPVLAPTLSASAVPPAVPKVKTGKVRKPPPVRPTAERKSLRQKPPTTPDENPFDRRY
ncbi:MAG TPA: hypothetical protein VK524_18105, partial [Polyangiaceae bacterium]|nr:hypothetical protein [Polyangiaceae bacterium]